MRATSALVAALAISAGTVHADAPIRPVEIPGSAANLGIWRLAAYGNARYEFTHCAISANYTNDMAMTIAVSHGGMWYVEWIPTSRLKLAATSTGPVRI